ncbi:MAG: hypothetical protein AAGC74_08985, partial [Verrucomicrobiota bacterium]
MEAGSLGRWPLGWPVVGAMLGIAVAALGGVWWFVLAVVGALGAGLWWGRASWVLAGVLALIFVVMHGERLRVQGEMRDLLRSAQRVNLEGVVLATPASGIVEREFRAEGGALLALVELPDFVETGDRVELV